MRGMKPFAGFPSPTEATPVPEAFYSEILPRLTSLAEAKVFLVALRRIRRRKGAIRWVTARELASAPEMGGIAETAPPDRERPIPDDAAAEGSQVESPAAIPDAMHAFADAQVFLSVPLDDGDVAYFLNDSEGRRAVDRILAGDASIELAARRTGQASSSQESSPGEIFQLYEDTIGPVPGVGMAQELSEAEQEYPAAWIREAFLEAATQNARSWAYVRSVLRNWRDRGKGDGETRRRPAKDYRGGQYGKVVRWR